MILDVLLPLLILHTSALASPVVAPDPSTLARRYVHSVDDFQIHLEAHRLFRVPLLMRALLKDHPEAFPEVELHTLREYEHDLAKETLYPRLYETFYARGLPAATPEVRAFAESVQQWKDSGGRDGNRDALIRAKAMTPYGELTEHGENLLHLAETQALIGELNRRDQQIALNFFRKHGMLGADGKPNAVAKQYLLLEKVADGVDRSMDPVAAEEFGVQRMRPAHDFMRRGSKQAHPLAESLEKKYWDIVRNYDFQSVHALVHRIRRTIGKGPIVPCATLLDKAMPPLLKWSRHALDSVN